MNTRAIVVVERDAMIRATLVETLAGAGHVVYGVKDASEAKAVVNKIARPCLILADLLSMGMSLTDFLRGDRADVMLIRSCHLLSSTRTRRASFRPMARPTIYGSRSISTSCCERSMRIAARINTAPCQLENSRRSTNTNPKTGGLFSIALILA